jgi:FAD/FMN-containing dehydrogenase
MQEFQEYSHEIGSIDVYNQGVMSYINGRFWSPGFRQLFQTVKSALDPNLILNPDLWMSEQKDTKRK